MSDPPFSLSVCSIAMMYAKKSTISNPIYHGIYYIKSTEHFYNIKNVHLVWTPVESETLGSSG